MTSFKEPRRKLTSLLSTDMDAITQRVAAEEDGRRAGLNARTDRLRDERLTREAELAAAFARAISKRDRQPVHPPGQRLVEAKTSASPQPKS